ncbi:hypothetical protein D3C87_49770 [compost metagenome]
MNSNNILTICNLLQEGSTYLTFVSVIIAIVTLYIAILARKEFLRNQTRTKQVEVMSDLISELNTLKIGIEAWTFKQDLSASGRGWSLNYNLFEIADLFTTKEVDFRGVPVNFEDCDDEPVLFDRKSNQIGNIKKFIDNPFLPKAIADKLINFYSPFSDSITREEICRTPQNIILLTTNCFETEKAPINKTEGSYYIKGNAIVFGSWLNLKAHSYELMKEINQWFVKHGIDDVNLRIDYKN